MVNRKQFIPQELHSQTDLHRAITMPSGDYSISQASLVKDMIDWLDVRTGDKVLDVGGGTGYHAACLAERGAKVFSIERLEHAFQFGTKNLQSAGITNVQLFQGDGFDGLPDLAPFDKITIACAVGAFPLELFKQLKVNGLLLYPACIPGLASSHYPDILLRIKKIKNVTTSSTVSELKASFTVEQLLPVKFIRGYSKHIPTKHTVITYGSNLSGGKVYDLDRPEISFLEQWHAKGDGPPLHYHKYEDEFFYVLEGKYKFIVGDRNFKLTKGEFCLAEKEVAHKFIAQNSRNKLLIVLTPAGAEKYFIEQDLLWKQKNFNINDSMAINSRYGMVLLEASNKANTKLKSLC